MTSIAFIRKKIGFTSFLWLQKANRYLLLEEPAWFVFSKTIKRYKANTVASQCADRYGLTHDESLSFVNDMRSRIGQMNLPAPVTAKAPEHDDPLTTHLFTPYSLYRYRFGEILFDFSFETSDFESYLHPMICHLETARTEMKVPLFELFAYHDQIVFRLDGIFKGVWTYEETHLVKGLIYMNLINVMFGKTDDFWLMTVHASAITNGQKTILISASPGSGKTTIAAMLHKNGYQLVSDDFVPIDRYSFRAWPFPLAMSVKQGSVNLLSSIYSELEQKPVNRLSDEKSVRYLFPQNPSPFSTTGFPVKEFIFIQYNPTVDFEWEQMDQEKAIKLLFDQSWISTSDGIAGILLNQLSQWSFYKLTYSNNQKALEAITHLFAHD